jgi:hypothetical protein
MADTTLVHPPAAPPPPPHNLIRTIFALSGLTHVCGDEK